MTQYYDEQTSRDLRKEVEKYILSWPYVTERSMFGCPAYLTNGRLFAFLVNGGVVITQIRTHDIELLSEVFTTESFHVGEREITRWLTVKLESPERVGRMIGYVKKSYEFALENR